MQDCFVSRSTLIMQVTLRYPLCRQLEQQQGNEKCTGLEHCLVHCPQSTYTGVYAKGGPKAVDPPKNDLSSFLDRSDADVRGVKKTPIPKPHPTPKTAALSSRKPPMSSPPPADFLRASMGGAGLTPPPMITTISVRRSSLGGGHVSVEGASSTGPADLKEMFAAFAAFGGSQVWGAVAVVPC